MHRPLTHRNPSNRQRAASTVAVGVAGRDIVSVADDVNERMATVRVVNDGVLDAEKEVDRVQVPGVAEGVTADSVADGDSEADRLRVGLGVRVRDNVVLIDPVDVNDDDGVTLWDSDKVGIALLEPLYVIDTDTDGRKDTLPVRRTLRDIPESVPDVVSECVVVRLPLLVHDMLDNQVKERVVVSESVREPRTVGLVVVRCDHVWERMTEADDERLLQPLRVLDRVLLFVPAIDFVFVRDTVLDTEELRFALDEGEAVADTFREFDPLPDPNSVCDSLYV